MAPLPFIWAMLLPKADALPLPLMKDEPPLRLATEGPLLRVPLVAAGIVMVVESWWLKKLEAALTLVNG